MNRFLFILFLTLSVSGYSQTRTQSEMNAEAHAEFKESDKRLNEIYRTILFKYNYDTLFIQNLRASQRIWIQFRDAEMLMKYPDYTDQIYGSIQPTCRSNYLKELTDKRIEMLNKWIIGSDEGNVCNGSVRITEQILPGDMGFATVRADSTIFLFSNGRKVHRIFGYSQSNVESTKLILFSIYTYEVKNNPYNCKYGAFYDFTGMSGLSLTYLRTEGDFLKISIIKDKKEIDTVFMLKKWFEFEEE